MTKKDFQLIADVCQSKNHTEHLPNLWRCAKCQKLFCWNEGGDDNNECDNCDALNTQTCAVCHLKKSATIKNHQNKVCGNRRCENFKK